MLLTPVVLTVSFTFRQRSAATQDCRQTLFNIVIVVAHDETLIRIRSAPAMMPCCTSKCHHPERQQEPAVSYRRSRKTRGPDSARLRSERVACLCSPWENRVAWPHVRRSVRLCRTDQGSQTAQISTPRARREASGVYFQAHGNRPAADRRPEDSWPLPTITRPGQKPSHYHKGHSTTCGRRSPMNRHRQFHCKVTAIRGGGGPEAKSPSTCTHAPEPGHVAYFCRRVECSGVYVSGLDTDDRRP